MPCIDMDGVTSRTACNWYKSGWPCLCSKLRKEEYCLSNELYSTVQTHGPEEPVNSTHARRLSSQDRDLLTAVFCVWILSDALFRERAPLFGSSLGELKSCESDCTTTVRNARLFLDWMAAIRQGGIALKRNRARIAVNSPHWERLFAHWEGHAGAVRGRIKRPAVPLRCRG